MTDLFLIVLETSVSTGIIILFLFILTPFLNKRYAAKWKYFIWIALALRLIIPINYNLPFRQIVIDVPAQITSPITTSNEIAVPITLPTSQNNTGITFLDIMAILWSAGCLLFMFVHILGYFHYKAKIIRDGISIENSHVLFQLVKLSKELQIKQVIPIVKYSNAASPMLIGFFRPILVLPNNEYEQEELFFILKHELIHLKYHDIFFKLLILTANGIHWFNPLIYLMQKEASVDMELYCDERVIQGNTYAFRKAYTETLLSTLNKQYKKGTTLTTHFYGGTHIMKKRFKNILDKNKKKNGFSILAGVVGITLILGMMTGCSVMEQYPSKLQTQTVKNISNTKSSDNTDIPSTPSQTPETEEAVETAEPDNTENNENVLSSDSQEIKNIVEEFASAYFEGDTDTIHKFLTNPYEWDIDIYEGTGTISDLLVKALPEEEQDIGSELEISLEFKDSDYENLSYLTFSFIKQEDGWKISFYGLEG